MALRILVVGAGSVGRRHLRNFASLGCRVATMDPRSDRLLEAATQVDLALATDRLPELSGEHFDGVVIASPPKYHVAQALLALQGRVPVLLEKPPSLTIDEALELEREVAKGVPLVLGYTYRWWPALRAFRDRLKTADLGRALHARFHLSAQLADWHPWERYQDFFMASRELGGGALLDESHFVDLMLWMFGMPDSVFARVEKLSGLEIDTDDNVDLLAVYGQGLRVSIHLDLYGRPHERFISVTGDRGTLRWSFDPSQIQFSASEASNWDTESFSGERNDMFLACAREFIEVVEGRRAPTCTAADGVAVMRVVEACRASSDLGCLIQL
jgi:predicted dehydrogenase